MRVPIARRFLDRLRLLWLDKTIRYAAIEISGETRRVSRTTMADVAAIASSSPLAIIIKMVYFWSICCGIFSIFSWKRKFFLSKEQVFWMTSIKILRVLDVLLFFFFCNDLWYIGGDVARTILRNCKRVDRWTTYSRSYIFVAEVALLHLMPSIELFFLKYLYTKYFLIIWNVSRLCIFSPLWRQLNMISCHLKVIKHLLKMSSCKKNIINS